MVPSAHREYPRSFMLTLKACHVLVPTCHSELLSFAYPCHVSTNQSLFFFRPPELAPRFSYGTCHTCCNSALADSSAPWRLRESLLYALAQALRVVGT